MNTNLSWFEQLRQTKEFHLLETKPLAYFCAEYALSDTLPSYAGGLGVLAGDYIKELADQKIPAVAVGLFYRSKYGVDLTVEESEKELFPPDPREHGVTPVMDQDNNPLLIKVPIRDHDVFVKAWKWEHHSVPVYLLDTNVEQNASADREITLQLYAASKETRLKQEMVLGIGGFRLLEALHIQPSIYHMNEGHSALLALELIRHEMQKRKVGFTDAQALSTHHVIFTNHTLVSAGNELFSNDLFTLMLTRYASSFEVPVEELVSLGDIADSQTFSLSHFASRLAGKINGVSKLHTKHLSKALDDNHIVPVTNGIHIPSWDKSASGDLMQKHQENKRQLLQVIHEKTGETWGEGELLVGWARRMVRYKRPLALFGELEQFLELAHNEQMPVRVIFAGIPHQSDDEGREILRELQQLISQKLRHSVAYLPNYNVSLATLLTSGCDVWLNTPVIGSEACGTSSMKAALNGSLLCTTKDGWVDEVDLTDRGWIVNSDTVHESLLEVLKVQIIPEYYASDRHVWETAMRNSRTLIEQEFSTTRMLKDYFEKLYLPIIAASYEHYTS